MVVYEFTKLDRLTNVNRHCGFFEQKTPAVAGCDFIHRNRFK